MSDEIPPVAVPSKPVPPPGPPVLPPVPSVNSWWQAFREKILGPGILVLLAANFFVLLGYAPQLSYLEQRVKTLQTSIDTRLEQLGAFENKFADAQKKLNELDPKLDGLNKAIAEKEPALTASLQALDAHATALKKALEIKDDDLVQLKRATEFVNRERTNLTAIATLADLQKRDKELADSIEAVKGSSDGLRVYVRELWEALGAQRPAPWYANHSKP